MRREILSGLRWTAGARVTAQVVTWAITLVVIRLLSPQDYGLLAMATVFITFLAMFSEFGLGAALVQAPAVDDALLRRVYGIVIALNLILAAALALAAPLIAELFGEPRVIAVIRVLSLQFVVAPFAVVPDALLQRRMAFRGRSLVDLASAMAGGITTLLLAMAGKGVWALVVGTLVSQTCKAVGLNAIVPFLHVPRFSVHGTRSLIRFGGHLTASQVLWILLSQIDVIICGKWLGREALGFYSIAMHVASLPNQRVSAIVNQIAFPAFARLQNDISKVASTLQQGIRFLSFFAFPVLWGISSVAPEVVEVIMGPVWTPAILPLQVLGLVMPLRALGNFVPNALQGIGRADILLANTVWALVILTPAFFIGATGGGLVGLSIAWLVASPIVFLQNMTRSLRPVGIAFAAFAAIVARPACAGLLMYAAVAGVRLLFPATYGPLPRLCAMIPAGAIVYLASSAAINRKAMRDAFELLRAMTARGTS